MRQLRPVTTPPPRPSTTTCHRCCASSLPAACPPPSRQASTSSAHASVIHGHRCFRWKRGCSANYVLCWLINRPSIAALAQRGDAEPLADREDLFEDGAGNRVGIGGGDLGQVADDVVGGWLAVRFCQPAFPECDAHPGER